MHLLPLSEREPAGGGLHLLRLRVPPDVAATHVAHGQYVEIRSPDGESVTGARRPAAKGFFVLASQPGSSTWELLVQEGGGVAEWLLACPIDEGIGASDARGPGFPVEDSVGKPLVFAVTGSGIAGALSTLAARIASGDAERTYLLYGVRGRSDVALTMQLEVLVQLGVDIAICLSREHIDEPGFFRGYVQHVASDRGWKLEGGRIYAVGNRAMIEAMREVAPSLGLSRDDVILNV